MVNLLKEIKASDNAIQQNLRKTGDPLVYDDGSITVEETTDPGKQVSNSNSDLKDKTPIPSKHHNLATGSYKQATSTDTSKGGSISSLRLVNSLSALVIWPRSDRVAALVFFSPNVCGKMYDKWIQMAVVWWNDDFFSCTKKSVLSIKLCLFVFVRRGDAKMLQRTEGAGRPASSQLRLWWFAVSLLMQICSEINMCTARYCLFNFCDCTTKESSPENPLLRPHIMCSDCICSSGTHVRGAETGRWCRGLAVGELLILDELSGAMRSFPIQ